MSILSETFDQELSAEVRLKILCDTYSPRTNKTSYIGTWRQISRSSLSMNHTRESLNPIDPKSGVDIKDNTLILGNAWFFGDIAWSSYDIEEISGNHLVFKYVDINTLPKRIVAEDVTFYQNISSIEGFDIRCSKLMFGGVYGNPGSIKNMRLNCWNIIFRDCPSYMSNITGRSNFVRFNVTSFDHIDRHFGNHVIEQTVGPKRIKKLTDIRALYNNPKKYMDYWGEISKLYDANALIAAMGMKDLDATYIYIKDCSFSMTFAKNKSGWELANAAPV